MTTVKLPISSDLSKRYAELKIKTGKSKRTLYREALEEFARIHDKRDSGYEYVLVEANSKQKKLDF